MPVRSNLIKNIIPGSYLLLSGYFCKDAIHETHKHIHEYAQKEMKTHKAHEPQIISYAWTLPIIPAILLFYPPYKAAKTIYDFKREH
jgi:hypothetical protein